MTIKIYETENGDKFLSQDDYNKLELDLRAQALENEDYLEGAREEIAEDEYDCNYDELNSEERAYVEDELFNFVAQDISCRMENRFEIIEEYTTEYSLLDLV